MKCWQRITFLASLLLLSACGPKPPDVKPLPSVATDTRLNLATGALVGFHDEENTDAWLGIPYAKAPIGELRWRAPRPAVKWEGLREATRFQNACPQLAQTV